MKFCAKCQIEILDETDHCPFCRCVVNKENENDLSANSVGGYPDAVTATRRYRFIGNLVLFLSIVAGVICAGVNIEITPDLAWSVVVILALIYANIILQFAILGRSGYREKAIGVTLIGAVIVVGIDAMTGYKGWSVNYVLPSAIIALDIGIMILMIVNRRNWQSYIMTQILMVILCIVTCFMNYKHIITSPLMTQIATAISFFLFCGTVIIGDRKARQELKRRFHI